MKSDPIYYHRNLPHYQPKEAIYSVVFRLHGSLPIEAILRLREEHMVQEKQIKKGYDKKKIKEAIVWLNEEYFHKFDSLLNGSNEGPQWLRDDAIAKIISDAIHYLDGKQYTLISYCIMPNHVHLVVALDDNIERGDGPVDKPYVLTKILQSLKRHTSRESNKQLDRTGTFWQHESYDHVVRDGEELQRTVEYIRNNPVTAGLVKLWEDWKWTYVNEKWLEKNL